MQQRNENYWTIINRKHLTEMINQQIFVCRKDVVFFKNMTYCVVHNVHRQLSDARISIFQVLSQDVTDLRVEH